MADTKLTALAAITTPVALDEFYVVVDTDSTPVSKKIAYSNLVAGLTTTAANTSLVDTDLVVAPFTNVQDFADGIDAAVLKARGTGVSSSYVSTVAVGGTTFAQPAVSGEINSDEGYFSISYAGATGITVTTLSVDSTYIYIDNTGALQQQVTEPTRQDWSRKMFTMRIAVDAVAETIIGFEYLNNPIGHYSNSIRDLYTALLAQGVPFKVGQTITGRATDLGFNASAGTIMEFGGTGDINNANLLDIDEVTNATYDLLTRTTIAFENLTDLVKFWDNAGTITALGSTTVVGHRLYRFSNGQFAMQYGQENYANIVLARAGVLLEDYDLNPRLLNATFFGWWLIQETATNTGGTTLTNFREYTIGVQGGSSSVLAGCLLQGNNLSDLLDAATARTNLGVIPLSGTTAGNTVSGSIQFDDVDAYTTPVGLKSLNSILGITTTLGFLYGAGDEVIFGTGDGDSTTYKGLVLASDSAIDFGLVSGDTDINLRVVGTNLVKIEAGNLSKGLEGSIYYGANYTDNTYVQKKYVDDELGNYIPLSGTTAGNPVTGDVEFANFQSLYQLDASEEYEAKFTFEDGRPAIRVRQTTGTLYSAGLSIDSNVMSIVSDDPNFTGLEGISYYGANYTDNTYVQKKYVDDGLAAIRKGAYKTADEAVNNTTTYVDDADMRVTIVPPSSGIAVYSFEALILFENASNTSIKYKVTTTNLAGITGEIAAQGSPTNVTINLNTDIAVGSFNNKRLTRLYGLITVPNTATTGDVIISWGQNAAVAADSTMLLSSSIIMEKVN
jgi:hypothetical protein